jgi:hypothetical protein
MFFTQDRRNWNRKFRPFGLRGIESFEFSQNLVSEDRSGRAKRFIPVKRKRDKYQKESATNSEEPKISKGQIESEDYHIFFSLIPMHLIALGLLFNTIFSDTQRSRV